MTAGTVNTKENDSISLTESSEIVRELVKFFHPGVIPDLTPQSARTVVQLAEASQKYVVHSAIDLCHRELQ